MSMEIKGIGVYQNKQERKWGIPDDDMVNWINTLREGGFTEEEIDEMMVYLNAEYAKAKGEEVVNKKIRKLEKEIRDNEGKILNYVERGRLKEELFKGLKK